MDLLRLYPIFLALVSPQTVAAHVEPPTNVTLHCHNLHNVLKWSYDQLSPRLRFRVDYGGLSRLPGVLWVNPPALEADVSFLIDPSDEYYITVTAVIGKEESEATPVDGIQFTYFKDSPAHQKCFIDFPPVNITDQQDDILLFRFTHPSLLYPQLLDSPTPTPWEGESDEAPISISLPLFTYDVVIINQKDPPHSFSCMESVCEENLPIDAALEKHCLKVTGELLKISLQAKQEYCLHRVERSPLPNNYIYIAVVSMLVFIAVVIVLVMVYKKKTKPSTSLPNSMTFTSQVKQWTLGLVQESVFVPEVTSTSPTPLLPTTEEREFTLTSSTEPDFRLRIGVPTEDEGVCDVQETGSDEGPGYMPGKNLEEDETLYSSEAPSGYEKRQVLVELGPDEKAEGYRG